MKKRLLSMLTFICILASLFAMSITVHAAVSISNYNTPDRYMAVGSWKNLYGQLYSSAGYDYVYAGVHYANGNKVSGVWDTHSVRSWSTGYNVSSLDSDIHLTYLPQGKYYYMIEVRDMDGAYHHPIGQYWFNVGAVWPSAPTVSVSPGKYPNKTTISWNACSYATYYDVRVYSGSGTSSLYTSVMGTTATSCSLSLPAGTYTVTVASVNGNFYEVYTFGSQKTFSVSNQTYTVSYGANGGSGAPSSQTKTYGTNLTLSSTKPTRTGYTFSSWKSSSDSATYSAGGTYKTNAATTMTAQWTANTYTVKYNANGGSGSTASSTHTYNTAKALTANGFSRTGYTFLGWSTSSSATSASYSNKQSVTNFTSTNGATVNLYAVWQKNTYTLYVRPRGGTWNGSTGNQSYSLSYQGTKSIPNPTKTGYTFGAWALDFSGSGHKITGSGSSGLLQVRGTPIFSDPVFSSTNASMGVYNNKGNGTVALSRVAKDSSFEMSSAYMMKITTAGEATPGLGGFYQGTTSKSGGIYYHVIAAKIPVGYSIQRASNACGDGATHTWLTPQEGTGKWETYIYKTQCGTSGSFSTFGHVYISGTAATSSKPVTWYVGYAEMFDATGVSSSGYTYTMGSGAGYLQALWVPNRYTVKYNGNGATSGSMSNSTHIYDTAKTLTANAYVRDGYEFLGWSTDSSSSAVAKYTNKQSVTNLSSTSGATVNLYAVWKKIPETSGVEFSETSYYGGKKLTLVSGTNGATIYYTTDGSEPTTSSPIYSAPLDFNSAGTVTVKAFAYKENYITSAITSFTISVGTTDVNYASLKVENQDVGKSVDLENPSSEIKVYYTDDGSTPSINSLQFTNSVLFTEKCDKTIKTLAVANGCVPSLVVTSKVQVEKVATPIIDFSEEWIGGATIKIACSTSNPTILYTISTLSNGSILDPLLAGAEIKNNGKIEISEDSIICAVAKKEGYAVSDTTELFVADIKEMEISEPYIDSESHDVIGGKLIEIGCETKEEAAYEGIDLPIMILYTLDGTDPVQGSTSTNIYTEPFFLDETNITIKSIAIHTELDLQSSICEETIEIPKMATPEIIVKDSDYFDGYTRVKITCETTNPKIYYTMNDEYPTTSSLLYNTTRFNVTQSCTIKAIAVREGYLNSDVREFPVTVFNVEKPSVATLGAEDITERTATLRGQISNDGGSEITYSKFYYHEEENGTAIYEVDADSEFKAVVTNLKPNTEYYFYAKAANEKGANHGSLLSFRTAAQISENPTQISLSRNYISMKLGTKTAVLATVLPENATNRTLVWKSDNLAVASVDRYGNITANSIGKTTITAIAPGNGLKDSVTVTVVGGTLSGEMDFSEIAMGKNMGHSWNPENKEETFNAETILKLSYPMPSGGNAVMATAYLARWSGVVLEEQDPYPSNQNELNTNQYTSDYHIQEVLFLPQRQNALDNNDIKKAIMEHGAVYAQFMYEPSYFNLRMDRKTGEITEWQENYYMSEENANAGGHAIAIVGWDDNYPKSKFKSGKRPEGNGAFICKNSWGTEDAIAKVGEDGYFYISYYDPYLAKFGINAVFNNIEVNTNYNKIYQYDPLGPIMSMEYDNQVYMSNVFPKFGETLEQDEKLEAVSFYTADKGISYEIYVIPEYTSSTFFDDIGECKARGIMEYAGYHTVELADSVELKAGNRFAVIVKLSSRDGKVSTYVEAPLESSYANFATADDEESFISSDGLEWIDVHKGIYSNTNVCVKAFTNCDTSSISLMSAVDNKSYGEEKEYTPISVEDAIEKGFIINPSFVEEIKKNQNSISLFEDTETEENGTGANSSSILVGNNGVNNTEGAQFPPRYDLREQGYVSSIKDQGGFNTCWAFATYASLESCLMKKSQNIYHGDNLSGSSGDVSGESLINYLDQESPVTNVFLNKNEVKIAVGNEETLYATIAPTTASDKGIVWNSDDTEIVQVDTSGTIRAMDIGEATITATNQSSGLSASCVVTVTEPATVTGITSDITEIVCNEGDLFMIDYEITPENAGNKAVEITFADDIATVSGGLITAVKSGETTITITTVDGGHSITIPLTVLASETDGLAEEVLIEYAEITDTGIAADIINENDNDVIGEIFIATYDKDTKKMIKVISEEITVPAGDVLPYSTDIEIASNHAVKIFIWKKQTIKPLCEGFELN